MVAKGPGSADATKVRCPGCGAQCLYATSNRWRPFCSEHCRSIDLGAWASERYRVGSATDTPHDPETSGEPP
jgi:uncharacterized protein